MSSIFDIVIVTCAEFYNPEHLAVDEVIVLFKGRVILKQYIPKKHMLSYKDLVTL
jgi:hypothetical protein